MMVSQRLSQITGEPLSILLTKNDSYRDSVAPRFLRRIRWSLAISRKSALPVETFMSRQCFTVIRFIGGSQVASMTNKSISRIYIEVFIQSIFAMLGSMIRKGH